MPIASTCRYLPHTTTLTSSTAATLVLATRLRPHSSPTLAMPLISETVAPMQLITSAAHVTCAQKAPKRALMHAVWPLRVCTPRRIVSSCAMKSTGMSNSWSSSSE